MATAGGVAALTVLSLGASPASGIAEGAPVRVPTTATGADEPAPTVVRTLAVEPVAAGATARSKSSMAAELARTSTTDYAMVGVTWTAGTAARGTEILVSTRTDGAWSDYQPLEVEYEPGDTARPAVRGASAPLWVGEADGIAVRVTSPGAGPQDVEVTTVEPDRTSTPVVTARSSGATAPGARITGPVEFPVRPDVITRKQWGADPDLGDECWAPRYGRSARAVVVHHTVNANDYSRRDAAAIVRSIQAYHTQGQGWCDIGYNFLIDRFGRIYEGRAGGVPRPVRGAHAGDYNTDTVGVSMIGDYDKARLPKRLGNAMVRLVGWRLGTSYTPVYGRTTIYDRRVPHILGHRDVMSTACPGRYGFAFLRPLRKRVRTYLSEFDSKIEARADRFGHDVTGDVFVGEAERHGGFITRFNHGKMLLKPGLGPHWLTGLALRAFHGSGGAGGPLGFPKSDVQDTDLPRVDRALFEHGGIYVTRRRAHAVYGRVFFRWAKLGAVNSVLGPPTSSVISRRGRETVRFRHGRITRNMPSDVVTVTLS